MNRTQAPGVVQNGQGNNIRVGANLSTGQPGTELDAIYDNDLQEEVVGGFIQYVGLTPTTGAQRQLQQALNRLFGGNISTISANATLTPDNSGLVLVNAGAGNINLVAPAVNSANGTILRFSFLRTDSSGNTVTISRSGSDQFFPGGATSLQLTAEAPLEIVGNGAAPGIWKVSGAASLTTSTGITLNAADGSESQVFLYTDIASFEIDGVSRANDLVVRLGPEGSYVYFVLDGAGNIFLPGQMSLAAATQANQAATLSQVQGLFGHSVSNVLSSRAGNTVYTNSTGWPMLVTVSGDSSVGTNLQGYVNGILVIGSGEPSTGSGVSVTFVVPAGATYEVTPPGDGLFNWIESY